MQAIYHSGIKLDLFIEVIFLNKFFYFTQSSIDNLLKAITVILLSSVKFAAGPAVVYFNEKYDFSFIRANFYTITGGMLGVAIVLYLSPFIMKFWYWLRFMYHRITAKHHPYFSDPTVDIGRPVEIHYRYVREMKGKKKFTARNRRIIRVWKKYGLKGVAFFTPIFLSIPIGTFIMTRLEKKRKIILLYLFISVVFWSFTLTTLFELLNVRMIPELLP